jgi:hypothetical protein
MAVDVRLTDEALRTIESILASDPIWTERVPLRDVSEASCQEQGRVTVDVLLEALDATDGKIVACCGAESFPYYVWVSGGLVQTARKSTAPTEHRTDDSYIESLLTSYEVELCHRSEVSIE